MTTTTVPPQAYPHGLPGASLDDGAGESLATMRRRPDERVNWRSSTPFLVFHLTPLLLLWTGVSRVAVGLLLVTFWARMFFITAGYHRYFAHRSYRMARVPQFLMALGGTTAMQKGPLWWAGHHRDHHRWSDTERDVHSPQKGFWWSHVGWILCDRFGATETERIEDFARFPELRFLNRFDWLGPAALAGVCFLLGGWPGLMLGFFLSTILLWHSVFFVNSLAHVFGRRRFATEDTSRNSALIAVLTMGEGWHNNHHHAPRSCRNGFFWWEWDPTFYLLTALSWVGVVRDLKPPPENLLATGRLRDGSFDIGMFRANWTKAARSVADVATRLGARAERVQQVESLRARQETPEPAVRERLRQLEALVESSLETASDLATSIHRQQRRLVRDR